MEYNFREIEKKWQKRWVEEKTYQVTEDDSKQKFYVLNMFPYPSGAGLHVGHPLGYIASDIYARYKRLQGFNVLNPMGYDAYGLPAEQYAIQTGQHPAITTVNNINRYREQLDKIGFSFDWNREIRTCDPEYYHWTQWAFQKMFNSYYCNDEQEARPIEELEKAFAIYGNEGLNAACSEDISFTAEEWNAKSEKEKQEILMNYRIAYLGETMVNWCAELGTVLANDEVVDGVSERGGFPVIQKKMRQWCLRVSAYAQRLLDGLDTIEWTDSLKETQRNWIGRSEGAEVQFKVKDSDLEFTIFTTRADTMFGVTFMVLAPESELVAQLTTPEQKAEVDAYLDRTKKRTERERIADRSVTGVFSGSYAINPFTGEAVPVWISDYVLAGYGTGAIMAVPAHDSRDYAFAKHFGLELAVYMVKVSYNQKPYRRSIMQTFGAEVIASPSMSTRAGRDIITKHPNYQGSLGTAISEAVELAMQTPNCKYVLGSVLNHVMLHQTVIGLEAEKQMEMAGEYPDVVIACFGGGSNFSGIAFPFLRHKLTQGKDIRIVAAEPASCPKLTRGQFQYDFGDEAGYTPLLPMFTLGHNFAPANIHAGGLRYHGAGSIVSQLKKDGLMDAVDIQQLETFNAATLFARSEGIIPAPESSHAIAAAIREAEQAKIEGKPRTILFNLSGHGLIDMAAYDQYLAGDLTNYEVTDADVEKNLSEIEKIIK